MHYGHSIKSRPSMYPGPVYTSGCLLRMIQTQRKALLCAHIIFMVAFVVHFSTIAYELKHPKHPNIRIRKTALRNIDFPVIFKFCVGDVKNKERERIQKLGYVNRYHVFMGSSMFNQSLVGWNGHTQNFSTLMSVRGEGINCQAQCLLGLW